MTDLEKAARQALEVLTDKGQLHPDDYKEKKNDAIADLRTAIEQMKKQEPPVLAELTCVCGAEWEWRNRDWELVSGSAAPVQEPVALEWDEVFDAAAAAYCRSEASRKALHLCFQSRQQATQISIGWTANELMAFAKTITYICTTPPAAQRQWVSLTEQEWERLFELYGDDPDILIRETEAKLRELNGGQE